MSFTVIKVESTDGSVTITPESGVGTVDLTIPPGAKGFVPTASKIANYNAVDGDVVLCNANAGAFAVTLPLPVKGTIVTVKKTDASANVVTMTQHAAETIDGANTQAVSAQWMSLTAVADGVNWFLI